MLSDEERHEIEAEFPHYPTREALSIDALRIVQKHRGWISDQALDDIGALLGLSRSHLDGVATFYNLIFRKPVGRHVIYLCDSVSCWIMGSTHLGEQLSTRLSARLGTTTTDGRFTLLPIVCLGACDHAPVLMVDGDLHRDVQATGVDKILEQYR